MALYKVSLTGYFSDEIDVEIETDEDGFVDDFEIERLAASLFEDDWLPYSSNGSYTHCWDSVEIHSVEEIENV